MIDQPQSRKPGDGAPGGAPVSDREAARAEALRANLHRRKAQARDRDRAEDPPAGPPRGPGGA